MIDFFQVYIFLIRTISRHNNEINIDGYLTIFVCTQIRLLRQHDSDGFFSALCTFPKGAESLVLRSLHVICDGEGASMQHSFDCFILRKKKDFDQAAIQTYSRKLLKFEGVFQFLNTKRILVLFIMILINIRENPRIFLCHWYYSDEFLLRFKERS